MGDIILGDNLDVLRSIPERTFQLAYIDPPFNTGKTQSRTRIKVTRDAVGDRTGFQGRRYKTQVVSKSAFNDVHHDYIGFLRPRIEEAYRVLDEHGSFFLHVDYREVHYCKAMLDEIFGRDSYMNEIIWAYDYGGRPKNRWPAKHDNILWYAKEPNNYVYNYDAMDRIPYMAPGLVGPEKAARGKTPTDVWWHTIVTGKEKTGYPAQKPLGIIRRIVRIHSNPGDRLLDFFAGSGTLGLAAHEEGRDFVLIDDSPAAFEVMRMRLEHCGITTYTMEPDGREDGTESEVMVMPKYIRDPEVERLASIAEGVEVDFPPDEGEWSHSPFGWIKQRESRTRGKIFETLVTEWLVSQGITVGNSPDSKADRIIEGARAEIKGSTLWKAGYYKFQQIRDQDYEFVVCLGISPFEAHCWVIEKEQIMDLWASGKIPSQHNGKQGTETAWITVNPMRVPEWLQSCGGTLEHGFAQLRSILT